MLQKIAFQPGINKQLTETGAEGQWVDCDNVRFRYGVPEKIGGWNQLGQLNSNELTGAGRGLHHFVNTAGRRYAIIGTNRILYAFSGNVFYDIHPIKNTTTLTSAFTTTNGSPTVTITFPTAHNINPQDIILLDNFSTITGSNFGASDFDDKKFMVTSVPSGTTITITMPSAESGSGATASGGIRVQHYYPVGTPVYKYEMSGVNLQRINRTHNLNDTTVSNPISFDSYNIKIDTGSVTGTGRSTDIGHPTLYLNSTKSTGGYNVKATQNIPFEIIKPSIHNVAVEGTAVTGQIRTTTSQSISGNEIPYVNVGFEDVTLNENNYLDSPRAIFSKVNEDRKLSSIEGNKSFQMRLFLGTTNSKLSPQIELQRCSVYAVSNRVNSEVSDYATDPRVNTLFNDPSACQYVSKEVTLANPASSIKIIVDAHIPTDADIRAFYAINSDPGFEPIFEPFPGYLNLDINSEVINEENNDGRPDTFVENSIKKGYSSYDTDFIERTFTIDDLPNFRSYRIKLVLASTSQELVPQLKNLRVLALA